MPGISESIDLDITRALAQVKQLESAVGRIGSTRPVIAAGAGGGAPAQVARDFDEVRRRTDAATAATGKYGRTLQSVAQIRVVQGLIAFFGGRALVNQINRTVDAASDLTEEMTRSEQVFVGGADAVADFGEKATTSVGLARREAIKAANDFGTMFRGAGLSGEEAARLSEQFVRLGADISSFSNLSVPDALEKLRAGLAGEIEPLRRVGFGFNDLEVQAKATVLGLRDANGELTEAAKLQARVAVIMEKTVLAQGDMARTSEGLANQQRFLRAETEQLREELGRELEPMFLDLTQAMRANLPLFAELAGSAIPLLIATMQALFPAGQALLQILVAISPALEAFAAVLNAIPQPVLQVVGTLILLNRLAGPLGTGIDRIAFSLFNLAGSADRLAAGGLVGVFSKLNPWVLGAAVGITALTSVLSKNKAEQARTEAAVRSLTAAFKDQAQGLALDVEGMTEAAFSTEDFQRIIESTSLSLSDIARLASQAHTGGLKRFIDALDAGGVNSRSARISFHELSLEIQDAAKAVLLAAVANGELTKSEYEAAIAGRVLADQNAGRARQEHDFFAALNDVNPALAAQVAATAALGGATSEAASEIDALEKAISGVVDTLDSLLGRFLDADEASLKLKDTVRDLASELAEGRKEGERLAQFQDRLRGSTIDLVRAVQDQAEAMARAGQITPEMIPTVVRERIAELIGLFPSLRGQLQSYIDLIVTVPTEVKTEAVFDDRRARSRLSGWAQSLRGFEAALRGTNADVEALGAGGAAAGAAAHFGGVGPASPPSVPLLDLGDAARQGAAAGAAAGSAAVDAIETTLRRSAASGLDLGGFLVEGISLGARQSEVDLINFFNGLTQGLEGVVADAMRIDRGEATEILQAVEAMDQATRDLADARGELGANSIEAKIAELELGLAQERVNDAVFAAIDSTEAYNEALKRVTDGVNAVTGSMRALNSLQDARSGLRTAQKDAEKARDALRQFDAAIVGARQRLAEAQATGDPINVRRAEATLADLVRRRGTAAEAEQEANRKLTDAQLDLLDAQQRLVDLAPQVADAQGVWEGYLRSLATQAGLTRAEIDALVGSLGAASQFALDARVGVLTGGAPVAVPTFGTAVGTAAAGSSVRTTYNTFYITPTDPTLAAKQVVSEMRVEELLSS